MAGKGNTKFHKDTDRRFGIRLNTDFLKEAEALKVLDEWKKKYDAAGKPLTDRFIFTCALLALDDRQLPYESNIGNVADLLTEKIEGLDIVAGKMSQVDRLSRKIDELDSLIRTLRSSGLQYQNVSVEVPDAIVAPVKNSAYLRKLNGNFKKEEAQDE